MLLNKFNSSMNKQDIEIIYIILYFVIIILLCIISYLVNSRSKCYKVIIVDFNTNDKAVFIVKARSKAKVYEVVSKYLLKNKIDGIIVDVHNTSFINNNTILNL